MNQAPEAVFVVERLPGKGYVITSAVGQKSQTLAGAAVAVLDRLGQPDPRGPEEIERWLPDAGPDQQPLFVRIRRTPEGESIYHQSWFPPSAPPPRPRRKMLPWLVCGAVLFVVGAALGWSSRPTPVESQRGEDQNQGEPREKEPPRRPEPAPVVSRTDGLLHVPLRKASEPRRILSEFLKQPGLTGWPDEAGVAERTIELRDFRKTPRGVKIEPVYLTADEAKALQDLLEALGRVP